jgi:NAD(P)-dependent dehydrogenase (short-subunit alcohol dehydrogenase family)
MPKSFDLSGKTALVTGASRVLEKGFAVALSGADEGRVDYLYERIRLERPGQPGDLDRALLFLASNAIAYVTGQTLLIGDAISVGAERAAPSK